MKKLWVVCLMAAGLILPGNARAQDPDGIGAKVTRYFDGMFSRLKAVADKDPSVSTFRDDMRPEAEKTEGLYGATLIDPDFVIRQVYFPSHFLARGYDLKKVKELQGFYLMMKEHPAPQLSEPGHGNLFQPRLIAMRYPVLAGGKLKNIVSMMVRTESFLKATGLDRVKAYRIIAGGKIAEEKGQLSDRHAQVNLTLPSTEWVIQYDP